MKMVLVIVRTPSVMATSQGEALHKNLNIRPWIFLIWYFSCQSECHFIKSNSAWFAATTQLQNDYLVVERRNITTERKMIIRNIYVNMSYQSQQRPTICGELRRQLQVVWNKIISAFRVKNNEMGTTTPGKIMSDLLWWDESWQSPMLNSPTLTLRYENYTLYENFKNNCYNVEKSHKKSRLLEDKGFFGFEPWIGEPDLHPAF